MADADVLSDPGVRQPAERGMVPIRHADVQMFVRHFFADDPLVAVSPSGEHLMVVEREAAPDRSPARFVVTRLSPAGDTVYSHRFRYTPLPLEEALLASAREQLEATR